jgi:hypothetical protein
MDPKEEKKKMDKIIAININLLFPEVRYIGTAEISSVLG